MNRSSWKRRSSNALAPIAAFLVIALASAGLAAGRGLRLSPDAGPSGTIVMAKGRGYAEHRRGTITFGDTLVASIRTRGNGTFRTTFEVPDGYAGTTTVTARVGRRSKSATFTVTPDGPAAPAPTPSGTPMPTPTPAASPPADAFARRVRSELAVFTGWLRTNNVRGNVGEFGWPNNRPQDQERYNLLAEHYLREMTAAGLRGTHWATGEWWGSSYHLSVYARTRSSAVDTPRGQAPILERHTDVAGVHVNGGEFGAPSGTTPVSEFSNTNPGTYNVDWHYDGQATFDYLASRGIREVVIPFRWERVQPVPGGTLDGTEVGRIIAAVGRARNAGLRSVPMVANYGAYWLGDPVLGTGTRYAVGTRQITISHFADLWKKLSAALDDLETVAAYGLMREPIGQPGLTVRDQAKVWEAASQAAVNAVRSNGDSRQLLVPGYRYSNLHNWPAQHPVTWIEDPMNNFVYEAHHYWDRQHSGDYQSYDTEVALSAV